MKKAVLFLIFNRSETTQRVFEAIRAAKPPRLYVASDGARSSKDGEAAIVNETRELVLNNVDWDCEVKTLLRDENLGCRNAVSGAITWFFENEKDGIILEDDCLPSQSFFSYCEELLDYYNDNKKVMHISGDQFVSNFDNAASYYFAKIQHCWGWAGWADRWKFYGDDLNNFNLKNIEKFSNDKNVQNYWLDILRKMQNNEIDSWAYQWAFKIIEKNGFCINPSKNLVSNIGFGEISTHTFNADDPYANLPVFETKKIIHPKKIEFNQNAVDYIYQNVYGIKIFKSDKIETSNELNILKNEVSFLKEQLVLKNEELTLVKNEFDLSRKTLENVYTSREWKMVLILQKLVKEIFPKKGFLRNFFENAWIFVSFLMKLPFKIFRKLNNIIFLWKNYFLKFKPKIKRKINKNSKKIVYVGHSYHNKTKSTEFLIEYLKSFYDVDVILDESWNGGEYPDLSFIDESYLGVIFFQNLPTMEILKNIKNDNLIFFPMYDGVPHDFSFWGNYLNLKVVNFSKTLHKKLVKWGIDSINVQYFPKSHEFIPGKRDEVFFWQRLTRINIDLISKLAGKADLKIHIHKAVDPNQQFLQPSKQQEKEFKITYSDWFETREQMWDVIKQKGVYVAPREFEGIGMSFLEAMAMGKAVIAVNNPTMNEYIKHGKNGYLFDLHNPKEINLSKIEQVQKNAYEYMKEGYERWEKDKYKIIEFIKKN